MDIEKDIAAQPEVLSFGAVLAVILPVLIAPVGLILGLVLRKDYKVHPRRGGGPRLLAGWVELSPWSIRNRNDRAAAIDWPALRTAPVIRKPGMPLEFRLLDIVTGWIAGH